MEEEVNEKSKKKGRKVKGRKEKWNLVQTWSSLTTSWSSASANALIFGLEMKFEKSKEKGFENCNQEE